MFELSIGANGANYSVERADELFEQQRQGIFHATDRLFVRLMLLQWTAGIVIAWIASPRVWAGQTGQIHAPLLAAIFFGGAISVFPMWMTRAWPGAAITRYVIAAAQMLMCGLLIWLTDGQIETHFYIFASLFILSFYRDWRVFIPATIVINLDHFLRGIYWPSSVSGLLAGSPLRSLELAGWIMFANIFLVISCLRSMREMRSIANRTAALEASEESFHQIFDDAPIGMAVIGLDESFLQVNSTLCQMVGYSARELKQRTTVDITFADDIPQGKESAEALLTGGPRSSLEKRYIRKNGEMLWATRTACLMRDVGGHPCNFLIMVEDVSERKRGEAALCESKIALEAAHHANQLIMDNSQDVICTVDEEGRFVSVSAACEQLWGYTQAELVGREYIEFVCPEDRAKTKLCADELLRGAKVMDFVNRYIRKDGTLIDVLWSSSWSPTDKIMFSVAHDVTERLRIETALREAKEEADRANHAKSEFLSRMSHELRTPLNAILGFSQLLERQNPTETQRTRVNHIISAGRHLLNLINEVLDISRIEAGNLQFSLEPVRVADALDEAISLMRPLAAERSIELVMEPLEQNDYVLADRQRLTQVMLNLLTNAIKYTPLRGKITVSSNPALGGNMRIDVKDTGVGISAEKLARLFTPFDRLGAEQTAVEGTGLGLALCRRLMDAMHGRIGVETSLGQGSTFWLELGSAASPLQTMGAAKQNGSYASRSGAGKRIILYVEDNLSNLTLVEQVLADQPEIELITAMQGGLGLELARQHSPDLILLDLHLPDLPGWEVLSRLQQDAATNRIPVIVISADATSRQIKRLLAGGARAYLTKPLDITEFSRVIDEITSRSNLPARVAA